MLRILVAIILAPVRGAFLPSDPNPTGPVYCHVRLHFCEWRGRYLDNLAWATGGDLTQQQVIAHFSVGIPRHPRVAVRVHSYGWLPIVFIRARQI